MRGWYAEQPWGEIPAVKFFKVYLFNDTVNNPDRIVLGNKIA
jgi:hypothetical protein